MRRKFRHGLSPNFSYSITPFKSANEGVSRQAMHEVTDCLSVLLYCNRLNLGAQDAISYLLNILSVSHDLVSSVHLIISVVHFIVSGVHLIISCSLRGSVVP